MNKTARSLLSATSRRALYVAYALSGLIAFSVFASDEKPPVDPRADELVKRMGDYLGQAKFFSVNAEVWQDVQLSSGERVQAGRIVEVQVRRPNRYHSELRSTRHYRELPDGAIAIDAGGQTYYYAGGAFYLQQPDGT